MSAIITRQNDRGNTISISLTDHLNIYDVTVDGTMYSGMSSRLASHYLGDDATGRVLVGGLGRNVTIIRLLPGEAENLEAAFLGISVGQLAAEARQNRAHAAYDRQMDNLQSERGFDFSGLAEEIAAAEAELEQAM